MPQTQATTIKDVIAHLEGVLAAWGNLPVYKANEYGRCTHFDLEVFGLARTAPPISALRGVAYVQMYGTENANAVVFETGQG